MISRSRSLSVARKAGVRTRITRLGNGTPAASTSEATKTTLNGWSARKSRYGSRSMAAWRRRLVSDHEPDVRAERRVREEHLLQLARGNAQANGDREQVDRLVGVWAEQVGAEDTVGVLLDEDLEGRRRLAQALRVEPRGGVLPPRPEAPPGGSRPRFRQAGRRQRRHAEDRRGEAVVAYRPAVALQEVRGQHRGVMVGLGGEGRPVRGSVAARVDGGVGDGL